MSQKKNILPTILTIVSAVVILMFFITLPSNANSSNSKTGASLTANEARDKYNTWLRSHTELSSYILDKKSHKMYELDGEKYFLVNEGEYVNAKFVVSDYVPRLVDFDEFCKESYVPELGYMSHYKFFSLFDPGLTPEELYEKRKPFFVFSPPLNKL